MNDRGLNESNGATPATNYSEYSRGKRFLVLGVLVISDVCISSRDKYGCGNVATEAGIVESNCYKNVTLTLSTQRRLSCWTSSQMVPVTDKVLACSTRISSRDGTPF